MSFMREYQVPFTFSYFRPGGVHRDLPDGIEDDIKNFCESFPKHIDDLKGYSNQTEYLGKEMILQITVSEGLNWGFQDLVSGQVAKLGLKKINPKIVMKKLTSKFQ